MIVLVMLLACPSARRSEPLVGPLDLDPAQRRGERVFERHCYSCHPGGEAGLGLSLNDRPLPGIAIRAQVRLGFGAMPRFDAEHISREQLDDLVVYLEALRRGVPTAAAR